MQDSHRCQDTVDEGASGRVGGHSPGRASRGVPLTQEMAEATSLVSEAECCSLPWGMSFLREELGDSSSTSAGFQGAESGKRPTRAPLSLARLERSTQIDVSSHEKFLVRPNTGRHVVAEKM